MAYDCIVASVKPRTRKDGSEYFAVLYRHGGKQTSTSFEDFRSANKFKDLINNFGADAARETLTADSSLTSVTVNDWITHHIDHLTGVDPNTVGKYRAYLHNDIAPAFGDLPLTVLTHDHIARWVQDMGKRSSAKTIANKHGFLAGALNGAIPKYLTTDPCTGTRLPRGDEIKDDLPDSRAVRPSPRQRHGLLEAAG